MRRMNRIPDIQVRVEIHDRPGGKFCAKLTEVDRKFDTVSTDQPSRDKAVEAARSIAKYRGWRIVG